MSVILAVILLMAGAFIGFILGALLSTAAHESQDERKKAWWKE